MLIKTQRFQLTKKKKIRHLAPSALLVTEVSLLVKSHSLKGTLTCLDWEDAVTQTLINKHNISSQSDTFATGRVFTSHMALKIYSHFSLNFTEDESLTDRMRTACTPKLCSVTWKMLTPNQHSVMNDYLLCTTGRMIQTGQKKKGTPNSSRLFCRHLSYSHYRWQ